MDHLVFDMRLGVLMLVVVAACKGEVRSEALATVAEIRAAAALDPDDRLYYLERIGPMTDGDGAAWDEFGTSVAVSGDLAVVGVWKDDLGESLDQGSAYVFLSDGTEWNLEAKLVAEDGFENDRFGTSVAIDGDTVVVGAMGADVYAAPSTSVYQGAAYVFVRTGSTWSHEAKLVAPSSGYGDQFGETVAISGDRILVGAPEASVGSAARQGKAFVFARSGTTWTQEAALLAPDGAAFDTFGTSVSLSGTTAIVGARTDDVAFDAQGSAHVFVRASGIWEHQAKLIASDGAAVDCFGTAVAVSGDTAVVGAEQAAIEGHRNQGATYVFVRTSATWSQSAKLTAADGGQDSFFGHAVGFDGQTVAVGAPNSAYVFIGAGSSWSLGLRLPVTIEGCGGEQNNLAVSGVTVVVGCPAAEVRAATYQGSALVFAGDTGDWTEQQSLDSGQGGAYASFGSSLALGGDRALAGAPRFPGHTNIVHGTVTVLERLGSEWSPSTILVPDTASSTTFGTSVALSADTALVGAPGQATAYVFARDGLGWTQEAVLAVGENSSRFGWSVALEGDTAVIGAPRSLDPSTDERRGAAYVFVRSGSVWSQEQRLVAPDGVEYAAFGWAVALSGEHVLVGTHYDPPRLPAQPYVGRADQEGGYVFARNGATWTLQQKLVDATQGNPVWFGSSIALVGDTALIGAPGTPNTADPGRAIVFIRDGTTWTAQQWLTDTSGEPCTRFGWSVALSGDYALVGATSDELNPTMGNAAGSAALFVRSTGAWIQRDHYTVETGPTDGELGMSVAVGPGTALVGAPYASGTAPFGNPREGAVYFNRPILVEGATCEDPRQCATDFCVDGVCCDTPCRDGDPNDCEACSIAAGATLDGICGPLSDATPCSDGSVCTQNDLWCSGYCHPGSSIACEDDGNECTNDFCDPVEGCVHRLNTAPCSDGDPCTCGDTCVDGVCEPGMPKVCADDGNPCTDEICVNCNTCWHAYNTAACSDGDPCTRNDRCDGGHCVAGSPADCPTFDPCYPGVCDSQSGECTNQRFAPDYDGDGVPECAEVDGAGDPDEPRQDVGCSCAVDGRPDAWLWAALLLLGARRRPRADLRAERHYRH